MGEAVTESNRVKGSSRLNIFAYYCSRRITVSFHRIPPHFCDRQVTDKAAGVVTTSLSIRQCSDIDTGKGHTTCLVVILLPVAISSAVECAHAPSAAVPAARSQRGHVAEPNNPISSPQEGEKRNGRAQQ